MEGLKNCVYSICVAAVSGSILYYLLPKGSLSKLCKIVFGVFFLCVILGPVINSDIFKSDWNSEEIFLEEISEENYLEDFYGQTEREVEAEIKAETAKILESGGVIYSDIIAEINISESGGIDIERFEVVAEEPLTQKILNEIENKIGAIPSYAG